MNSNPDGRQAALDLLARMVAHELTSQGGGRVGPAAANFVCTAAAGHPGRIRIDWSVRLGRDVPARMGTVIEPIESLDLTDLAELAQDFADTAQRIMDAEGDLLGELAEAGRRAAELSDQLGTETGLRIGAACLEPAELGDDDVPEVRIGYELLDHALQNRADEDSFVEAEDLDDLVEAFRTEQLRRGRLRNALGGENATCVVDDVALRVVREHDLDLDGIVRALLAPENRARRHDVRLGTGDPLMFLITEGVLVCSTQLAPGIRWTGFDLFITPPAEAVADGRIAPGTAARTLVDHPYLGSAHPVIAGRAQGGFLIASIDTPRWLLDASTGELRPITSHGVGADGLDTWRELSTDAEVQATLAAVNRIAA